MSLILLPPPLQLSSMSKRRVKVLKWAFNEQLVPKHEQIKTSKRGNLRKTGHTPWRRGTLFHRHPCGCRSLLRRCMRHMPLPSMYDMIKERGKRKGLGSDVWVVDLEGWYVRDEWEREGVVMVWCDEEWWRWTYGCWAGGYRFWECCKSLLWLWHYVNGWVCESWVRRRKGDQVRLLGVARTAKAEIMT